MGSISSQYAHTRRSRCIEKLTGNLQTKWPDPHPYHKGGTPNTHQTFPIFHKSWLSGPYPAALSNSNAAGLVEIMTGAKLSWQGHHPSLFLLALLCPCRGIFVTVVLSTHPCIIFLLTPTAKAASLIRSDLETCIHLLCRSVCPCILDLSPLVESRHRPYQ